MILAVLLATAGCGDDRPGVAPVAGGIVSLTPAGTDLLVAMGLADRVVGVSPFEANESLRRKLPKVGDYLRVDWEQVTELRPKFLVVQGKRDRLPPGTREKCKELGITTVILQIDRLADIRAAIVQLGDVLEERDAASRVTQELARRTQLLEQATPTPVPAAVAFSDSGTQFVGRRTFIDDALTLAGGANVIEATDYVSIDAEKLASLKPKVVFLILPGGDDAAVNRTKAALRSAGLIKDAMVFPITDADALLPGTASMRLAETMARHLRAGS